METFEVAPDVYGIDIGLIDDGFVSVYLFDDAEPTLVDAGAHSSADAIRRGLATCGIDVADLANIVVSHIHTDHSGAASVLAAAATNPDVYVHERTADHLIDPTELVAASKRAMGDRFDLMGAQEPVPAVAVREVDDDGTTLDLGASGLELLHAPGHSPDHLAAWNPERRLLFAGEALGQYYPRADRWLPPATVPHFDIAAVDRAIDRLEALDPQQLAFPHFGEWPDDPAAAFERARIELHRVDERILDLHAATDSREETRAVVADELVDLSPPYHPAVEAFLSRLLTDGYLRANGIGT